MTTIPFRSNSHHTIGIEVELGLVDAGSMALSSSYGALAETLPSRYGDRLKPELMQCVIELNTDVCQTVGEAELDLREKLGVVERAADQLGLGLWWGATHPFSLWREQQVTPDERYRQLV
ncbi:MAG: glutamate-cysteine ligase family protein, partial [Planctomycetota bacterium]